MTFRADGSVLQGDISQTETVGYQATSHGKYLYPDNQITAWADFYISGKKAPGRYLQLWWLGSGNSLPGAGGSGERMETFDMEMTIQSPLLAHQKVCRQWQKLFLVLRMVTISFHKHVGSWVARDSPRCSGEWDRNGRTQPI